MTLWIRTGCRSIAVLCALLATSGVAYAQVEHSQGPVFADMSIGRIEMPLSAAGGTGGPYTWSVIGDLPPGLALRTDTPSYFPAGSSGIIGVATAAGTYNFTLRVTDGVETVDQVTALTITLLRVKDSQVLPDAFVGVTYSYQLTALDNAGSVAWAHTDPVNFPLPPGVTLSVGGLVSGIPTTANNVSFSIGLDDGVDIVYQGLTLRVSAIEISTPGVLPNATLNTFYTATIAAAGGTGGLTFSQNGGLPNGLSMDSSGFISGTVTNAHVGKYQLGVTATDTNFVSYTKQMSIDVVGAAPLLPNIIPYGNVFDDCTVGVPCNRGVSVFFGGTAPFTWSIGGVPPSWMDIRTGDGVTSSWITPGDAELWGTPDAAGTFNVQLTVTDATGATATNTFQLKVSPLLQLSFLPNATLGSMYSQPLRVIGGVGPYTAARTGGTLAAGISLEEETLTLSGTPTESGYFSPVFTYTDATDPGALTLTTSTFFNVNGAGSGGININTNGDLGWTTTGSSYSRTLDACCAGSITWSQIGGSLPTGVNITSGGLLSGTPTSSGPYTFLIKAEDGANAANYAVRQFTLNVTAISINGNSPLTSGNVGTFYTNTFTATGGTGTLTWGIPPFSFLPPGMTLAVNGTLSGTPAESGQFVFTVSVSDTTQVATRQFSLSMYPEGVDPPVSISTSSNFGTFSIGQLETELSATGGNSTFVWTVVGGTLPTGLAVRTDKPSYFSGSASAGLIGVATAPGLYSFTLRATSGSAFAELAATLRVTALTSKESQLPDAFVGVPYSYQLSALGYAGAGATWTPTSSLPGGLTLSTTGQVSGTPTTAGFPNFGFSLTDGVDTVFKGVNFSIYAVRITTAGVLPNATQGSSYTTTILAAGGAGTHTFNASGLPNGLSMNSSSGVISGTVSSNASLGKGSISVTATSSGVSYTKTMSIDVLGAAAALPSIAPSSSFIYDCTLGVSCNRTISVQNGGAAPFTWTASGLPPGMSMRTGSGTTTSFVTPGDAQLWGTPTAINTYNVTLTVTDSLGATATNTFPMKVSRLMQTTFLPSGTIDTAYSQTLRVLGGTGPYTAVQSGGQLAAGLSVNGALVLGGIPTESGNFNPVFTYTDSAANSLQLDSSFFINGAGGSGFSINTSSNLGSRTTGSSLSSNPISFSACCATPITWSVVSGSLPTGVTLSSGGSLSGTPSVSGQYTFLLKATGTPSTHYAVRQFTLNVTPLSIQTSTLPFGNVDTFYNQTLTATGGTGAVVWTLNAGSYLPPGLSLASNGVLSGTPAQSGQYLFSITATDSAGPSNVRSNSFRVSIYPVGATPPVAISTGSSFGTYSVGQIETQLIATGGNGTYTWSLLSGTLPPGISIRTDKPSCCFSSNASAGLIGIATTPNLYNFTLRVSSGGTTADLVSSLRVTALMVKENQLPDAFVGVPYSYTFSATGNAGTVTWTGSGGLPSGLSLSSAGVISGTPTNAGFFGMNFSLTDTVHTLSNKNASLNVYAVRITSPAMLPNVTEDTPYSATITAAGGAGGHTFYANGLPNGLSLDSETGEVSGTVDSSNSMNSIGNHTVNVTVSDSGSASYYKTMSIDVVGAAPTLPSIQPNSSNIYDCTLGVPCSRTVAARDGGTAPFTWTANGLPPGMSIRFVSGTTLSWVTPGDAELWGAATATGTYSVELTVTDALAATVTDTFPMTVSQLMQTAFLQDGTLDTPYSQTLRVIGGTMPYTVVHTDGQLPAGVTVNGSTLVLGGTPVESGWGFNPVFTYTDSASHTLEIENYLFINGAGNDSISIDQYSFNPLTAGSFFGNQFTACCAGSIVWSKIGGNLPPGLTLSTGGLLDGTPSTAGTYTFLLKATDGGDAGNYAARQFTLIVSAAASPTITPSATTVAAGALVTATIANGPGSATDWVALFATGAPSTSGQQWQYLNGTQTAPNPALTGGTLSFTLPLTLGTYELRFFQNNTYTVLATSAPITVAATTITPSATTVAPGASVEATVANGPGSATDWVALFVTGAPAANGQQWQYLNGTRTAPSPGLSGGTLTFTMPVTPGTYEVRFFQSNTYTVLATSATITVAAASVTPSATTVAPGASVEATVANGPGSATDWVALFATGAPATSGQQWQYLNGIRTAPSPGLSGGTLTFTMPVTPGTYQVRFFQSNTYTVLATSATITVAGPSVTPSATTVATGASMTATIANGPGSATDWVALFATGAPAANGVQWQYLNGTRTAPSPALTGGTLNFTVPLTPGTYELRFFGSNSYTLLATSATITVVAPSVTPSATTVAPSTAMTATIANGPGNTTDWVALYATGAPAAAFQQWKYLSGTQTAPSPALTGATLNFTSPLTPGTYELRFMRNNTYAVIATSATITVQ